MSKLVCEAKKKKEKARRSRKKEIEQLQLMMLRNCQRARTNSKYPKDGTKGSHTSFQLPFPKPTLNLEVPKIIKAPPREKEREKEAKKDCSKKELKRSPWKQSIMQTTLISA